MLVYLNNLWCDFLNNVLINDSEGTGSLISLLKDKGLAKSLTAEIGDGICHTANIFSIRIGLTNSGILEVITFYS